MSQSSYLVYIVWHHTRCWSSYSTQCNRPSIGCCKVLQKHAPGVLNVLLDLDKELGGLPSIEKTVVIGECNIHHGADLDLAVNSHGTLLDGVQAEDCTLREVDDGGAHHGSKDSTVADREGTARHVLDGKLVVAGLNR